LPLALLIVITYTSPAVALGTESRSSDPRHTPGDHADAVPKLVAAASMELAGRIEELIGGHGVRQAAVRRAEVPGTATHMDVQHALVRLEKGLNVSSDLILKWSKSHQLASLQGEGKYNRNDEEVARLQTMLNKFQEMSQRKRAPLQAKIAEMERIEEGLAIDVQQAVSAKKVKELDAKRQKLQKEQVKIPAVKQPVGQKQDKLTTAATVFAKTTHKVASPKQTLPSPVVSAAAAGTHSAAAQAPVTKLAYLKALSAASASPPKQDATEIKEDFAEYLSESPAQPPKRHLRKPKKTQDENVNLNVPLGPVKVSAKLADFLTVEAAAPKVVESQSEYIKRLAQMHSLEKDASAYLSDDDDLPEPGHNYHKSMSALLKVATRLGQTQPDAPKAVGKSTPTKAVVTSPPKKLHKSMATLLKVATRMTKASKARRLLSAKLKAFRIPRHKTKAPEPTVVKVAAKTKATAPQKVSKLASKPIVPAQKKAAQVVAKAPQPKAADVTKVAAKAPEPKLVKVAAKPAATVPKKVAKLASKPIAPAQKKAPLPKAAEVTKVAAKVPEPKLVKVAAKPVATTPTKVAKSASKPVAPTQKKAAQVVAEAPQPKAAKVTKVVAKAPEPQVTKVTAKPVATTPTKVVKLASEAVAPTPEKAVAKAPQLTAAKVAKVVAKVPEPKLAKVAAKPFAIVPKVVQMAGKLVAPVPENALNSSDILRIMRIEYSSTSNGATTSIVAPAHHTTTHDLQSAKAPQPEKVAQVALKMPEAKVAKVAEKPAATVPNKVVKLASKPVTAAPKEVAEKVMAKAPQPKAAKVTKVVKKLAKPQLSKQQPQHALSMSKVLRGWLDGSAGHSKAVQEDATVHTQVHMSRTLHEFLTGNAAPITPAPGSFEQLGADYLAM